MVARERFELSSAGPEPAMLDHYTTGLHRKPKLDNTNKSNQIPRQRVLFLTSVGTREFVMRPRCFPDISFAAWEC